MACSALRSISIPDGVTVIDREAFNACSSLTSISIPRSVTSIGMKALSGCSSLMHIFVDEHSYADSYLKTTEWAPLLTYGF